MTARLEGVRRVVDGLDSQERCSLVEGLIVEGDAVVLIGVTDALLKRYDDLNDALEKCGEHAAAERLKTARGLVADAVVNALARVP